MAYNTLTEEERDVIEEKGTERPGSGEYDQFYKEGTYVCRKCNNPLFSSKAKFEAGCGWPSFDDSFPGALAWLCNLNGDTRVEIRCANCGAHLGHVFEGERMTDKNTRHCVNSLSIRFIPKGQELPKVLFE